MKRRGSLVPIGSFLQDYFEKKGWASELHQYRIFTNWDKIVGNHLGQRCQPLSLRNQILTLSVSNSSWLTQLQFMKSKLVQKIKEELNIHLKDIYFRIGHPEQAKDLPQKNDIKISQVPSVKADNPYISELYVKDSELRQIIENVFKKHTLSEK